MNSAFNIFTPASDISLCNLLIKISSQEISYLITDDKNTCVALVIYHFAANTSYDKVANNLKEIVASQPLLQKPFKKVNFIYGFPEAILVPHKFISPTSNAALLELTFGDTSDSIVKSDFISSQNIHTVYRVPKQIDSMIAHLFAQADHRHLYTLLPDMVVASGNLLYCIFSPSHITIQLFKAGKLQIIQNFQYKIAADVSYHLLNVCQRFEVSVNDTVLYLNGMIDNPSGLYKELFTYFAHLHMADLPQNFIYNEEIRKFPSHYFSHLFQLASCV